MDFQFPVKPPAFQVMLKPVGPACNLNCTYCYYLEKKQLYASHPGSRMEERVLEKFIKSYIEAQDVPLVSFVWQGGEPCLLGVDYFKKALALQKKYAGNKKIENSLQTNGTLLTDEFCSFLKDNDFLVGISLDGPRELHDHYRVDKQGKPSWEQVMKGLDLLKKYGVEFNTLSVVNRETAAHPLEVYRFLRNAGSAFMQFIPIVERERTETAQGDLKLVHHAFPGPAKVTEWSVLPEQYGHFMTSIFDEWVRNDVGKYYVQLFDVTLANWVGANPGLCIFSETCGTAAVLEYNGDLYSCDHFVYRDYYLGNVMEESLAELMGSPRQSLFGQDKKASLPPYCLACDVRFACHGDCPKHRFICSHQGDPPISYLCKGYKHFFSHVKPYMDFMAKELKAERPPANVMPWVRNKDKAAAMARVKIGRNDPCPCGSGKKFKHCHMNRA